MSCNSVPFLKANSNISSLKWTRMVAQFCRTCFQLREIAEARRFVEDEVARHQGQYFSFVGREPVTGTLFERIGDLSWFRDLLADLSAHVMGRKASPGAPFQVLRVLAGETGRGQSMLFHYDAYVITALVPVAIPQNSGEPRGDLILSATAVYPLQRCRQRVGKSLDAEPCGAECHGDQTHAAAV